MRKVLGAISVLCAALMLPVAAFAYTSPGEPTGYVNDFAGVLRAETISTLNTELNLFEASTSNQIAVVTVRNLGGDYIEHYAAELFKDWGIGKEKEDNGVLLLLAIDDRELRIEVGYGLEGALPDSLAQRIINNDIVPLLKEEEYDAAVQVGVEKIAVAIRGEYVSGGVVGMEGNFDLIITFLIGSLLVLPWGAAIFARSKSWWAGGVVGVLLGVGAGFFFGLALWLAAIVAAALGLFGLILDFIVSNAYKHAWSMGSGTSIPWWAGGGHTSGSSSGSWGGFGGGSSGGGGASGSW